MRFKAMRFSCAVAGLLLSVFISTSAYAADVIKLRYAMWMPPLTRCRWLWTSGARSGETVRAE
jgi:hypothetical protein